MYGTLHGPGYSGAQGISTKYTIPNADFSQSYRLYAIEWEQGEIRWYVDDYMYKRMTRADIPAGTKWVFDNQFFIIFNVAVGGGWPKNPDSTTQFPQTMSVDYVRVYQG